MISRLNAQEFMQQKLNQRRESGTYRQLKPQSGLVDFCSNDYLGFAQSAALQDLINQEIQHNSPQYNGSTGSRLLAGNTWYAEELEQYIAGYHGCEAALLFNSGYDANLGLFSSLPQRGDTVIHDELIHASIIDGIRLSHAARYSFKHNDIQSLENKLKQAKGQCYVVVESIYSMDGDRAPLSELVALTKAYQANLIIDEAHATGVFGKGLMNQLQLQDQIFARVITFGKALGCHGAVILGSSLLRQYLINFSRSFIYTTAAPFHQLAAIRAAYRYLDVDAGEAATTLQSKIKLYIKAIGLIKQPVNISSPIQTIVLGSNQMAVQVAARLQNGGFDVRPILSPTVPTGTERIRICLHAFNTDDEIIKLAEQINQLTL
jgi:8-amino-7-oxononanoate synthase